jgi:hypothetical protein
MTPHFLVRSTNDIPSGRGGVSKRANRACRLEVPKRSTVRVVRASGSHSDLETDLTWDCPCLDRRTDHSRASGSQTITEKKSNKLDASKSFVIKWTPEIIEEHGSKC